MKHWTRRNTIIIGVTLILLTNLVALLGVVYNQSGMPSSTLQLSQRELQIPYRWRDINDNSEISLRLKWRNPGTLGRGYQLYDANDPGWLNKAKLASLGFNVSMPIDTKEGQAAYRKQLSKPVFLALEFDGPAYRQVVELARKADADNVEKKEGNDPKTNRPIQVRKVSALSQELNVNSRLFVIDASLNGDALRAKYPDTRHYCIVRGQIQPTLHNIEEKLPLMTGYIKNVAAQDINVPLEFRHVFEPIQRNNTRNSDYDEDNKKRPAFDATLAFGKRLEPWLAAASAK